MHGCLTLYPPRQTFNTESTMRKTDHVKGRRAACAGQAGTDVERRWDEGGDL